MNLLQYDFMVRALIAALIIGVTAPSVGVYLVQRRLALMGDGIGHIALTGVALGLLVNIAPLGSAVAVAAAGALAVEQIRTRWRTSGDVALAMLFYGGIALGVLLLGLADVTSVTLVSYLFGSLLTTSVADLWLIGALAVGVLVVTVGLRPWLFAVSHDEEYARTSGVPVGLVNALLAVTAAITVTVAMRVVGVLLISALMVVPVATAQHLARSFRATLFGACALGAGVALAGAGASFYLDTAPGATIVVLAIAVCALAATAGAARTRWSHRRAGR